MIQPRKKRPTVIDQGTQDHPVDRLYAWVAVDAKTGHEGIIAGIIPSIGSVPLVTSEKHLAEWMRERAEAVARESGRPVRLVEYHRGDVITTIEGAS